MAKTIKSMGFLPYLDDVYAKEGGSARLIKIRYELKWPQQAAADEFGVDRETIRGWYKLLDELPEEEKTWL